MAATREQIVENLVSLLDRERVVTDETVLRESSIDRFRRLGRFRGKAYHRRGTRREVEELTGPGGPGNPH